MALCFSHSSTSNTYRGSPGQLADLLNMGHLEYLTSHNADIINTY